MISRSEISTVSFSRVHQLPGYSMEMVDGEGNWQGETGHQSKEFIMRKQFVRTLSAGGHL